MCINVSKSIITLLEWNNVRRSIITLLAQDIKKCIKSQVLVCEGGKGEKKRSDEKNIIRKILTCACFRPHFRNHGNQFVNLIILSRWKCFVITRNRVQSISARKKICYSLTLLTMMVTLSHLFSHTQHWVDVLFYLYSDNSYLLIAFRLASNIFSHDWIYDSDVSEKHRIIMTYMYVYPLNIHRKLISLSIPFTFCHVT